MAERETLEVDVLIVGGGPAGMSAALRLAQLQKEKGGEPLAIAVLEKAREAGAHMLSGALLDPSTLKDLDPRLRGQGRAARLRGARATTSISSPAPRSCRLPITPPLFQNHGNYIISLNRFVKWLGGLVEAEGIDVFTGFSGHRGAVRRRMRVVGVRTGDRGIGKHGEKKSTFEPGVDIRAKVTIFTDGVRGNLTKSLVRQLGLDEGKSPQVYAIGIKELWEVPAGRTEPGRVVHTMGYPLQDRGVRRRVHVRAARQRRVARARHRARLPRSDVRSARRVPALQAASAVRVDARRRADGPLRRQGAARGRLVHDPEDLRRRRADRRRRRRAS